MALQEATSGSTSPRSINYNYKNSDNINYGDSSIILDMVEPADTDQEEEQRSLSVAVIPHGRFELPINRGNYGTVAPNNGGKPLAAMLLFGVPPEIQNYILFFLSYKEVGKLALVNREFKRVSEENLLWKELYKRDYNLPTLEAEKKHWREVRSWKKVYMLKKTGAPPLPEQRVLPLRIAGHLLKFFLVLFSVVICIPMLLAVLCTFSHRSLLVVSRLIKAKTLAARVTTVLNQFFAALWDALCFFFMPYLCFYIVVITLYRLPAMIKQLLMNAPAAPLDSRRGPQNRNDDCLNFELNTSTICMMHALSILRDLLAFVFLFIPILLTVHRVPHLYRRLKTLSYYDWTTTTSEDVGIKILVDEFYQIIPTTTVPIIASSSSSSAPPRVPGDADGADAGRPKGARALQRILHVVNIIAFLVFGILLYVPLFAITVVTLSPRSILISQRLYKMAKNKTTLGKFILEAVTQLVMFVWDMLCFLTLPHIGFVITVVTIYRLPALWGDLWDIRCLNCARAGPRNADTFGLELRVSQISTVHGFGVFFDLLSFVFLFLPLVITVHRLPSACARLKRLTYRQWLGEAKSNIMIQELKMVASFDNNNNNSSSSSSSSASSPSFLASSRPDAASARTFSGALRASGLYRVANAITRFIAWMWAVFVALFLWCIFLVFFIAAIPCAIVVLCTLSHRSVILMKRLKELKSVYDFVEVSFIQLLMAICDLVCFMCVPYLSFYMVCLTVYRLPALLKKLWTPSLPNTLPTHRNKYHPRMCMARNNDVFSIEMSLSFKPIAAMLCILLDILTLVFIFLPILISVHRLPHTVNRLKKLSYEEWANCAAHQIMLEEFKKIGMYQRRQDAITNEIIATSV